MGIGSPRLLGQLVRRTALLALVSLVFAPSAFADDGLAIDVPAAPELPDASAVTQTAPAAPVVTPLSSVASAARASVDVPVGKPPARIAITPAAPTPSTPSINGVRLPATAQLGGSQSDPPAAGVAGREARRHAARPKDTTGLSSPRRPVASRTSPWLATGLPQRGASVRGFVAQASTARSHGPEPRLPQSPPPAPFGSELGSLAGTPGSTGLGLLLLVLAAELAVLSAPGLGRRLKLLLAAPRPYPYLLELERPD
jgi:hypothetical protein